MASKRKSGEMSTDKCPITGLPVNEKLAKKLKSFDTANKKTIQRVLQKDFSWSEPANTSVWTDQDWYNEYANTLLAAQRNSSAAAVAAPAVSSSSRSTSRASLSASQPNPPRAVSKPAPREPLPSPPRPEPIRPALFPARHDAVARPASSSRVIPFDVVENEPTVPNTVPYNPQLGSSTPPKRSGVISALFWIVVLGALLVGSFCALLYVSASGQKLIAATANSAQPSIAFAQNFYPVMVQLSSEVAGWLARLMEQTSQPNLPADGLVPAKNAEPEQRSRTKTVVVEKKEDEAAKAREAKAAKEEEEKLRKAAELEEQNQREAEKQEQARAAAAEEEKKRQEREKEEAQRRAFEEEEEMVRRERQERQRQASSAAEQRKKEEAAAAAQEKRKTEEAEAKKRAEKAEAEAKRAEEKRIAGEAKRAEEAKRAAEEKAKEAAAGAAEGKLGVLLAQDCEEFSFFDCSAEFAYEDCAAKRTKCEQQQEL